MPKAFGPQQNAAKGPYFVVEMTTRWKQREIVRGQKPTYVHRSLLGAAKAAAEFSAKYPERDWAVFECIGYYTTKAPQVNADARTP